MNKPISLVFAITAALLLIGVSAALSFRNLWIAGLLIIGYFVFVAFTFIYKAKIRKNGDK